VKPFERRNYLGEWWGNKPDFIWPELPGLPTDFWDKRNYALEFYKSLKPGIVKLYARSKQISFRRISLERAIMLAQVSKAGIYLESRGYVHLSKIRTEHFMWGWRFGKPLPDKYWYAYSMLGFGSQWGLCDGTMRFYTNGRPIAGSCRRRVHPDGENCLSVWNLGNKSHTLTNVQLSLTDFKKYMKWLKELANVT
jgi:hypothetical protein